MALINFKEIDFKKSINTKNKIINFNDSIIEVVSYLSMDDKYDLIMTTLQKSLENNTYNSFKIDMYFNLHVVYLYTNIVFSAEDREDEAILYDKLEQSGLMTAVINAIDEDELDKLKKYTYELVEIMNYHNNSFFGELKYLIDFISPKAQELEKKINKFIEQMGGAEKVTETVSNFLTNGQK